MIRHPPICHDPAIISPLPVPRGVQRSYRPGFGPIPILIRLLSLLLIFVAAPISYGASTLLSTNLPAGSPTLPDPSLSIIRVFGAMALVIAVFLVGVWLFKNWQRLTLQRGRPTQLHVLEMRGLAGKHMLYVVAYQQQRLLLAASPSGVSLVSHLPASDPVEVAPQETRAVGQSFRDVLQQAIQGKS